MPINSLDINVLAPLAAGGLINSLLAGFGLAVLAWLVSRVARRCRSGTRFVVWFVALIGIALLPWVGSVAAASSPAHPTQTAGAITLPESLAYYLVVAWIIGAALGLGHVAHGLYRLRRLRASCTPVDLAALDPALRASFSEIASRRPVTLCVSEAVRVPAAIGYFRPMVVFPSWAMAEIPPQEINAILVHEMAHLRRYDDWTNLAQKLVKALFFFHPAVWFIESRLTLEREMACDDAVLAASFAPRAYAESLVSFAEKSFLHRGVQLAQAAVGHVLQLKLRLVEILRKDRTAPGSSRMGRSAVALMSLAALVAAYGTVRSAHWITFADGPGEQVAQAAPHAGLAPAKMVLKPVNLVLSDASRAHVNAPQNGTKPVCQKAERLGGQRVPIALRGNADRPIAVEEPIAPPVIVSSLQPILTGHPILVIFQGETLGPDGPVLWRVTVLHISAAQQVALSGGIPKQI